MLSSEVFEPRRDLPLPKAGHGAGMAEPGAEAGALCRASGRLLQDFDHNEPWDAEAAEALTRLYESDEGQLHKPHAGERVRRPQPRAAAGDGGTGDRAWLERHLSELAERLQSSLARLDPDASFLALSGRLEAIEERFGLAVEGVAQRADVQGLSAIETNVLELRDRLERIGAVEEEVRGLGQRFDQAGRQQLGALGKLLRECIGEWRESEQRTASALHNLEEAINRLGDTVDAMEASKPAPDLSLPALAVPEPGPGDMAGAPLLREAGSERAPKSYHALLDAADYAPSAAPHRLRANELASAAAKPGLTASPVTAIEWSAAPADDLDGHAGAQGPWSTASRIMTLRAKLRRNQVSPGEAAPEEHMAPPATDPARAPAGRGTRAGLLLIAGAAFLAGGAYLVMHALTVATPPRTIPAKSEAGTQPAGIKSDLADPTWRAVGPAGTAG